MKTMTTGIALVASLALVGCNSSDSGSGGGGGSSSVSLKSPTFIITESNRDSVDSVAYSYAGNVDATDQLDDTTSRALSLGEDQISRALQPREIAARFNESETEACFDSGSVTYSASGSGINENTGEMQSSGSMKVSMDFNQCKSTYSFDDGLISISMSWSGYDGYNSFDTLSLNITFNDYTSKSYYGDGSLDTSESIHGYMDMSLANDETSASLGLSISSSEIDNKVINIETTSPIKQRGSDYPYTGTIVVTGGDNTTVTYTVVSNGVEVSLNGGQAELITWSDMSYYY
ncbi:hypothetical protein [Saccharospirillum salsuginis]|nr:hypothetical protein [Saccharospirillum salsuginis]